MYIIVYTLALDLKLNLSKMNRFTLIIKNMEPVNLLSAACCLLKKKTVFYLKKQQ